MKKLMMILALAGLVVTAQAQQTTAKSATPVMKVDQTPANTNVPVSKTAEPKACCAGKAAGHCEHDAKGTEGKACCKDGKGKCEKGKACCKNGGKECKHDGKCSHDTEKK
jgi:hypothetical protein